MCQVSIISGKLPDKEYIKRNHESPHLNPPPLVSLPTISNKGFDAV